MCEQTLRIFGFNFIDRSIRGHAEEDVVDRSDGPGIVSRLGRHEMSVAARAVDPEAFALHGREVRAARDEGDVGACFRQRRTVSASDPAGANNRDTHRRLRRHAMQRAELVAVGVAQICDVEFYPAAFADVEQLFAQHGKVDRVSLMADQDTGRSRGFAFVEMPNSDEAEKAISALNGTQLGSRTINVNEARPKPERNGGRDKGRGGARRGGRQR